MRQLATTQERSSSSSERSRLTVATSRGRSTSRCFAGSPARPPHCTSQRRRLGKADLAMLLDGVDLERHEAEALTPASWGHCSPRLRRLGMCSPRELHLVFLISCKVNDATRV